LAGDFNFSFFPRLDKMPSSNVPSSKISKVVTNLCSEIDVIDIWRFFNPTARGFTFYSSPHQTASCTDHILLSSHMAHLVTDIGIDPITISDHAAVTMSMSSPRPVERFLVWGLNPFNLLDDEFRKFLNEQTKLYLHCNDIEETDPRAVWEAYKAYMRVMIISYTSKKKKEQISLQLALEKKKSKLEEEFYTAKSEKILIEIKEAWSKLNNLVTKKAERDVLYTRQCLFEKGNKANHLLARLARMAPSTNFISAIKDENGQRKLENKKINGIFKMFFEKLYSSETDKKLLQVSTFFKGIDIPQVSDTQKELLNKPISSKEIKTAIISLQSGKTP
uniref:Endonuclease/exonuclease/phosphatase domain-containing protein n=1 Tax=Lepisosteus oculatus TaxID=7918 RepID=W5NNG6_LEPOC